MSAVDAAAALVACGLALATVPVVIACTRRAAVFDWPGPQKVHTEPVPTLGGLSLVLAVLGTLWGLRALGVGLSSHHLLALTCAALPVVMVGVWDDLGRASIGLKILGHGLAGAILFAFGVHVLRLTNPFGDTILLGPLALPATLLWVMMVVNAMNLADGLDGLSAGIGAIAALSLSLVGAIQGEGDVRILGLVMAAAIAGFYPYNFPRARVFLGDVGSTFIGLVLATVGLLANRKTTTAMTLLVPLVALGLPVLDTLFAVVRRTASGRNPLRRDLGHLHHRLVRLGLSPQRTVAVLLGVTALLGAVAILLVHLAKQAALSIMVIGGLAALAGVAGLTRLERRSERLAREAAGVLQKV